MNDLPFIFYRPRDMFLDTVGMSKDGKVAHRQLADYVWYNDGPAANENDLLREITSCTISDWARVKRELIGKGWVETPKFFLHKGIIKTLNYSKKKAVESHNKTAVANKLPKHELLDPHPETGVCAISVTPSVTLVIGDREGDIIKYRRACAARLEKLFGRTEIDVWTYAEESTLCELMKRPAFEAELGAVEVYHGKNPPYFPQSLCSLLSKWSETLDRARNYERNKRNDSKSNAPDRNAGTYNENKPTDGLTRKVR